MQQTSRVPATFCEIVLHIFLQNNFKMFAVTKYGDMRLREDLLRMFDKETNFFVVSELRETHIFYLLWFFPIPISTIRYFKRAQLVIDEQLKVARLDVYDMNFGNEIRRKNLHTLLPGNMLNLNFQKVDSAVAYNPAPFYYDEHSTVTYNPLT